jgi:N-acyl-D-aspartate/D-glutamate deacylase
LFYSLSNHSLNIEINQLQPFYYKEEEFLKILQKIDEFSSKQNIHFDVFPENFTKIKIQNLLPSWFLKQKVKSFLELRKDKFLLERVIQGVSFNFFDNAYLISLPKPLNFLNGRSLKELAQSHECSVAEEFIKIAILSKNKGEIIIPNLNQEVLEVFVNHQKSILSLDYHFLYEDIGGDFYTKLFSLPRMIYKLTTLPAKKFGIYKRGEIKEGNYADLVVFKENKPFYVFINGKIVLKEGNFIGGGVGRHLKHNF